MSFIAWFSLFFIAFAIIYYLIGEYAGREAHTETDYFLAGRKLGFWSMTGTLLATQVGAGLLIGSAREAYLNGLPGLFYGLSIAVGFSVLGLGIAGALRSLSVRTTAEIFERYFGSPFLKKLASLLSIISLGGIFVSQIIASRDLLHGLGLSQEYLFLGFWLLLIVYTMSGGLPAVVATDLLQIVLILGVFFSAFCALWWQGALTSQAWQGLTYAVVPIDHNPWHWFAYMGMPLLYSLIEQDLAQRFFAARSAAVATASVWAAGLAMVFITFVPALMGVQARLSGLVVGPHESPLTAFVALHMGPIFQALVMCALIAAIASTADSLLCAISSNVIQDFLPNTVAGALRMRIARVTTGLLGACGLVCSYYASDVLGVMIESYALLVSSILVSVFCCLWGAPRSREAAMVSVFAGCCVYGAVWLDVVRVAIPGSLLALGASGIGYLVGLGFSRVRACIVQRC